MEGYSFIYPIIDLAKYGQTPLPNSWFIYTIFYTYLVFYISAIIIPHQPQLAGLLSIVFTIAYVGLIYVLNWKPYWYLSIPFFLVGYYIALYDRSITRLIINHRVLIYSTSVLTFFFTFFIKSYSQIFLPISANLFGTSV